MKTGGPRRCPRQVIEACVDTVGMRLTAARLAHQREGSERFTVDQILAEEYQVFQLVDTANIRASAWVRPEHTAAALKLSEQQHQVVTTIASTPQLVVPLSAPAGGAGKTTSMRALRTIVEKRHKAKKMIVIAPPTGKAVDVALAEGAASAGYTMHAALKRIAEGQLTLGPFDVVIVDEAGMVGTGQWHQLLSATTAAGTKKTVMVGDAHQLAPVKARGGMFAQLCDELPWTQRLSEVWRQHDAGERAASLALRDGGPAPVRRAIDWYRNHHRLACGDQVTMAADALAAHQADLAAGGKDSLLLADTVEMTDALNRRVHDHTAADRARQGLEVATVTGHATTTSAPATSSSPAATTPPSPSTPPTKPAPRSRLRPRCATGSAGTSRRRHQPDRPRIAARRHGDQALAVFADDYLREHVQLGHAVTVHTAQGVTAETTHAVLADTATRNLAYVALTRGRASNHAYLYQRTVGGRRSPTPRPVRRDSPRAPRHPPHPRRPDTAPHHRQRHPPRPNGPPHRRPDTGPRAARAGSRTGRRPPASRHHQTGYSSEIATQTTGSSPRTRSWARPQSNPKPGKGPGL